VCDREKEKIWGKEKIRASEVNGGEEELGRKADAAITTLERNNFGRLGRGCSACLSNQRFRRFKAVSNFLQYAASLVRKKRGRGGGSRPPALLSGIIANGVAWFFTGEELK